MQVTFKWQTAQRWTSRPSPVFWAENGETVYCEGYNKQGFTQYRNWISEDIYRKGYMYATVDERLCRKLLSCYRDFSTDLECNVIKVSLPDYYPRLILHWHNSMNFHAVDMSVTQRRLKSWTLWMTGSLHSYVCTLCVYYPWIWTSAISDQMG